MAGPLVPYAFCFQTLDQQIISFFLYKMAVKRQPLAPPHDEYVHEEDLFDFKEPWEIWEEYGGDEDLYFLCELKKTGLRVHRKIGEGTWSEKEHELVYNENRNPIGWKKKFRYENRGSDDHGGWILDEYSLLVGADGRAQKASKDRYDFPFVICRLRKNRRSCGKKRNN
ncbi:hypothetical protein ACFX13_006631 [Malus domestica]|nr:uncharacterized protein LOC126591546 [Malus sylvestris]